jgi:hypothetical protein
MGFSVSAWPPSKTNIDSLKVGPKDWSEGYPFKVEKTESEPTIPNLEEGQEFQFRVNAVDAAGPGEIFVQFCLLVPINGQTSKQSSIRIGGDNSTSAEEVLQIPMSLP